MYTIKHHKGVTIKMIAPRKLGRIKDGRCIARVGRIEFHSLRNAKRFINSLTK